MSQTQPEPEKCSDWELTTSIAYYVRIQSDLGIGERSSLLSPICRLTVPTYSSPFETSYLLFLLQSHWYMLDLISSKIVATTSQFLVSLILPNPHLVLSLPCISYIMVWLCFLQLSFMLLWICTVSLLPAKENQTLFGVQCPLVAKP